MASVFRPLEKLQRARPGVRNLFYKEPCSEYFKLCRPHALCWSHPALLSSREAAIDIMQMSGHGLTLLSLTEHSQPGLAHRPQ